MARKTFGGMMSLVKDEVLLLSSMVEQATLASMQALLHRDVQAGREILSQDRLINEKRYAIENAVLVQMATQQPMARDLRFLAAILGIISELERMGDYAKGIGKISVLMENSTISIPASDFEKMASLGLEMLQRSMTAFVNEDANLAERIPYEDKAVDACYRRIHQKVTSSMIANPELVDQGNQLMWAAHNLERLADRTVNICERIVFTCTGEMLEFELGRRICLKRERRASWTTLCLRGNRFTASTLTVWMP